MTHYDVFNGDADGLCSLHRLRLQYPLAGAWGRRSANDSSRIERCAFRYGERGHPRIRSDVERDQAFASRIRRE
jgi:hypothetical protein